MPVMSFDLKFIARLCYSLCYVEMFSDYNKTVGTMVLWFQVLKQEVIFSFLLSKRSKRKVI